MQNTDIGESNENIEIFDDGEGEICHRESSTYCTLVTQILQIINCLEKTLHEDEELDYKLWMTLGLQTQKIKQMHMYLNMEKSRTRSLTQLVRGLDYMKAETESEGTWPGSVISFVTLSSISPLLMKQRYDELSNSFENYKKVLTLRNSQLNTVTYDNEKLRANFDDLLDQFNGIQRLLEKLCNKYFRMQQRKNQEIQMLKEAISSASDCILSAEIIAQTYYSKSNKIGEASKIFQKFVNKLSVFKKCLRLCKRKELRL